MKSAFGRILFLAAWGISCPTLAKMTPEQIKLLPPPTQRAINFSRDIKPILEASCIKCHGRGRSKGDFRLDSRETLLKGGEDGPVVVAGKSEQSLLVELVAGIDPDNVMPQKGSRLKPEQISLLRGWIDQGLPWDEGVSFGRVPPRNLTPRRPELPKSRRGFTNPIDVQLERYFETNRIKLPKPVEDRVYARRVYLDAIGLLPAPEELAAFVADKRPDKRERIVQRLLADNPRYAAHWLTFWNDLLRNDYRGTGYIDGGREQITYWLFSALLKNLPYDQFVEELINPNIESEGFTKGILWRGAVNASQIPPMQAAQNVSQIFMGVNLKCASCHDSFINDWTLADAYGLANIYADEPLEIFQCDRPTGREADTQFIYPQLGTVDPRAEKSARLRQLADVVTSKQNGRLTRTVVNRLWAKLMGRGLVEPVDDMEQPAWNSDLLDWLAEDLSDHGYDLKHTIQRILASQAYQLPGANVDEQNNRGYIFRGPVVRRLSAEQLRDAVSTLTGLWNSLPATPVDFLATATPEERHQFLRREAPIPVQWIWNCDRDAQETNELIVYFRKEIQLDTAPAEAAAFVTADFRYTLYINGKSVTSGKHFRKPSLVNVLPFLSKGENVIAVQAANSPDKDDVDRSVQSRMHKPSVPAGLFLYARVRNATTNNEAPKVMDFSTDSTWLCSTNKTDGWQKRDFMPTTNWSPATVVGGAAATPWYIEDKFVAGISSALQFNHTRAALVPADPLMAALGRPNRDQVVTSRPPTATTLQALELTNGETLTKLLKRGAERVLADNPASNSELATRLYAKALGRKPTGTELKLADELLGKPVEKEHVEDLLWALAMLPEFQLIY